MSSRYRTKFPDGKLNDQDQGELEIRIATLQDSKLIKLNFGKLISWVALRKEEAIEMATAMLDHAEKLK